MKGEGTFSLGVTLYSFNAEFYSYRYSLEDCMERVGALGPGQGVEIVGPQMIRGFPEVSGEFLARFSRAVERNALVPTAYGAYADPRRMSGRLLTRDEQTEYLKMQFRSAKRLGFPIVRVQPIEPVFQELVPYAERLGLRMGIEIHSPNTIETMESVIARVEQVGSTALGFIPDWGIFSHSCAQVYVDRYRQLGVPAAIVDRILQLWVERAPIGALYAEVDRLGGDDLARLMATESQVYFGHSTPASLRRILPMIVHVHGKFFGVDEHGQEPAIDVPELVSILSEGGYGGYVSCEYEGHHWLPHGDTFGQLQAIQALIRRALQSHRSVTG